MRLAGNAARARPLLEADLARQGSPRWWGPFTYLSSATALAAVLAYDRDTRGADTSTTITVLLDEGEGHAREQLARGNDHWAVHYNLAAVASVRASLARGVPSAATAAKAHLAEAYSHLTRARTAGFRDHLLLAADPAMAALLDTDQGAQLLNELRSAVLTRSD